MPEEGAHQKSLRKEYSLDCEQGFEEVASEDGGKFIEFVISLHSSRHTFSNLKQKVFGNSEQVSAINHHLPPNIKH